MISSFICGTSSKNHYNCNHIFYCNKFCVQERDFMPNMLRPGLIGESRAVAHENTSAYKMGSGILNVYSTPSMIALMEAAAVNAVDYLLDDGMSTVGIEISIRHLSATPIGEDITAIAEVTRVDDKRIVFEVRAWDEQELIGEGTHIRYIITNERFMARLEDRL
jgi:fluoroacetyl-CoA thioesterase